MKHILILLTSVFIWANTHAQSTVNKQAFSLSEAIEFATLHSPMVLNSQIDLEIAKKKIWETTAMGLPHVSGKLASTYMIENSATIEQFSGMGDLGSSFQTLYAIDGIRASAAPEDIKNSIINTMLDSVKNLANAPKDENALNDLKWTGTFDLTATQLVFSGAYIVGLQTTKAFKSMSELAISKSKKDLEELVSNAYYLVLVMQENKRIITQMNEDMIKTVTEMAAFYKSGFIEETALDQIKLTANNLQNTLTVINNQVEIAENLLRFQMGYNIRTKIVLTQKLEDLIAQNIQLQLLSTDFNLASNTEYKMLQTQTKFSELQLKLQKTSFLPDVFAFYQYQHNFNDKALSFTPPQMVGASVNIPIFSSGERIAKVGQARLQLIKSRNNELQASQGLVLQYSQAQSNYSKALNKLDVDKENVALSQKIYNKTLIKFKNGVSTSMELTQAQQQLLQAQTTYYGTVLELANAKNALDKLLK